MEVRRLELDSFRNIRRLGLALPPGRTVLFGENAQGKSNILEALSMFAAAKSVRAGHERELVCRETLDDEIPFARIAGDIQRARDALHIEVVLQLGAPGAGEDDGDGTADARPLLKRIKVNGVPRRASDLIGEVQAVLFEPQDIELVYGPPALRRRHLDITLSQVDRKLLQQLQRYSRVMAERNSLLKTVREGRASPSELAFWDEELIASGAYVTDARRQALAELEALAREVHRELAGGQEELGLIYHPSVEAANEADTREAFRRALAASHEREVAQGVTVVGPHRDDLAFEASGADLASLGSRGQQRLATLSLKLAEARFMTARAGEQPLLLLDDVLSELDVPRRGYLLERIGDYRQSIITTADLACVDRAFLSTVNLLHVRSGAVESPVDAR